MQTLACKERTVARIRAGILVVKPATLGLRHGTVLHPTTSLVTTYSAAPGFVLQDLSGVYVYVRVCICIFNCFSRCVALSELISAPSGSPTTSCPATVPPCFSPESLSLLASVCSVYSPMQSKLPGRLTGEKEAVSMLVLPPLRDMSLTPTCQSVLSRVPGDKMFQPSSVYYSLEHKLTTHVPDVCYMPHYI